MKSRIMPGTMDGFPTLTLANEQVSVTVVPELGGKIISLRHLAGGREWMWRPETFDGLFSSSLETPFEQSNLAGWDECLPTIAPCEWRGRKLPDHGEVWMSECEVTEAYLEKDFITTSLVLPISPLRFTRTLSLDRSRLRLSYLLENLSDHEETFVWAMHPLFAIKEGDRLELPPEVKTQLPSGEWSETLELNEESPRCVKCFADTPEGAAVSLRNLHSEHGLSIRWDGGVQPVFGLWLTRGGWHGHHHLALEPTNAKDDALTEAVGRGCHGMLSPLGRQEWQVEIELF